MRQIIKSQRGDTIVEVMIALTVLAMAFSIAYATANKALLQARNAQEHTEALQYLSGQVELIRARTDNPKVFAAGTFCMDPVTGNVIRPVTAACTITPAGSGASYVLTIDYVDSLSSGAHQDHFTATVKWQGVGTFGPQQEQLFYKVHQP
ncbi:MAG: hypothetical protein JWO41_39 [Candidatus Saccharibacteria bacterium]|nr:hypothetical protein [Candidatus Saccharibacteria bacterium]